ncbi:hypothetical protein ACFVIY_37890 [Streptomyces sp. NPDC127166]
MHRNRGRTTDPTPSTRRLIAGGWIRRAPSKPTSSGETRRG